MEIFLQDKIWHTIKIPLLNKKANICFPNRGLISNLSLKTVIPDCGDFKIYMVFKALCNHK